MLQTQPNLLFVFPDEWRRSALGANGTDPVITPHLDAFARQGRVITNAISNLPICSPYRAMLLTGQFPPGNGVMVNCNTEQPDSFLRTETRCLPDVWHDAGYSCGYIGKWHLELPHEPYVEPPRRDGKVWDEWTPPERRHGFDFWHAYGAYDQHFTPHYWTNQTPREAPLQIREWSPRHETDIAIEYLRNENGQRDADKPFALMISMNPPHMPFAQVPPEYVTRYGDATPAELLPPNVDLGSDSPNVQTAKEHVKNYFAACTGVDEQFGRILATLDELGLAENTIVIFTSDHGEMMGSHDLMYKSVFYEESLGVPFIVRWPGHVPVGTDDLLLGAPNLMPTLLGLMGLGDQIPSEVQGIDLSAALLGDRENRPTSTFCLAKSPTAKMGQTRTLRTLTHLFAVDQTPDGKTHWLFDLENDPYEMNNIASANVALCAQLEAELHRWMEMTGNPWPDNP